MDDLKIAGAEQEELDRVLILMEKETFTFDKIKTIRDQILTITKEHEQYMERKKELALVPPNEKSFRDQAAEAAQNNGNDKVRHVWSMAREIEFNNLNILMQDSAYILAGVKALIVFNLNTMSSKYDIEKPLDIINAYGMDVWDNTEQN